MNELEQRLIDLAVSRHDTELGEIILDALYMLRRLAWTARGIRPRDKWQRRAA